MKMHAQIVMKTFLLFFVVQLGASITIAATDDSSAAVGSNELSRVLILTGQNNHDWRRTSPMIKQILDETGMFEVTIWNGPGRATNGQTIRLEADANGR